LYDNIIRRDYFQPGFSHDAITRDTWRFFFPFFFDSLAIIPGAAVVGRSIRTRNEIIHISMQSRIVMLKEKATCGFFLLFLFFHFFFPDFPHAETVYIKQFQRWCLKYPSIYEEMTDPRWKYRLINLQNVRIHTATRVK